MVGKSFYSIRFKYGFMKLIGNISKQAAFG